MRHLSLVPKIETETANRIFQALLEQVRIELPDLDAELLKYGQRKQTVAYYFQTLDGETGFRFVLDQTGEFASRVGIHVNMSETDPDHLLDLVNQAERDNFETIYLHSCSYGVAK